MAGLRSKEIEHNNLALDALLQEAEEVVATAVKGLVTAAAEYVLRETPQWSGDMVAQWRIVKLRGRPHYKQTGYKGRPGFPRDPDDEEPYNARTNPNDEAVDDALVTLQNDIARMTTKDWVRGVSLVNPHPEASLAMEAQASNAETRVRHPRAFSVTEGASMYAEARFRAYRTRASALKATGGLRLTGSLWGSGLTGPGSTDRKARQEVKKAAAAQRSEQRYGALRRMKAKQKADRQAARQRVREEKGIAPRNRKRKGAK